MANEYDTMQIISSAAAAVCAGYVFLHWQNNGLRVTRYVYESRKIPREFDGYKILQVSDYHNTRRLKNKIIDFSLAEGADITVITGDLVDCRRTDLSAGLDLVKALSASAPVYYVSGNHEARISDYPSFSRDIRSRGGIVLDNTCAPIFRKGARINLIGMSDPGFYTYHHKGKDKEYSKIFTKNLAQVSAGVQGLKILLSHRPEYIECYRQAGIDLALTGHAHGGQFGIPFTDIGVLVPNQGFFPPYAAGMKKLGDTTEIISRGIGNSVFPFRLANRPELVTVELKKI